MKRLLSILFLAVFATISCLDNIYDSTTEFFELPFENNNLKMESISSAIPEGGGDLHFFNETTGVIITYYGEIFKTWDSGQTWSLQYSNPTNKLPLHQILFIDQNIGYVVGGDYSNSMPDRPSGGVILKTMDGGESWTKVFEISGLIECSSITANNNGNLFVIGKSNPLEKKDKIFKSVDGGINWDTIDCSNLRLVKIISGGNFIFCTGGFQPGKIHRSSDDGKTWSKTSTFINSHWTTDLEFLDSIGFCLADNKIYKATDFGENWTQVHSGDSYNIDLLTPTSCLIWGTGGWYGGDMGYSLSAVRQTTNGGKDWIDYNFNKGTRQLRCSSFYSTTEGYGVMGIYLIKVTVK